MIIKQECVALQMELNKARIKVAYLQGQCDAYKASNDHDNWDHKVAMKNLELAQALVQRKESALFVMLLAWDLRAMPNNQLDFNR